MALRDPSLPGRLRRDDAHRQAHVAAVVREVLAELRALVGQQLVGQAGPTDPAVAEGPRRSLAGLVVEQDQALSLIHI
eukprot:11704926-Alexandrium_andersonii.AAC.1